MAEEIIFKTGVDTGNSVKEVNKLEKSLKGVDDEINKIKKDVDQLDPRSFEEIAMSTDSLEKKFADLNKKIAETPKTLNGLNAQMEAYKAIALQAEATDPIRQEAITKAGQLKDAYNGLEREVNNLANDHYKLQQAMELGSTVVAGYGAVQSAMALTGSDSEELQKSLQKLMAVQTLMNSINQIKIALEKESALRALISTVATKAQTIAQVVYTSAVGATTGAMKALKIAMLAIPIVAIVAGIMAVVGAMTLFNKEVQIAEYLNEQLTKSFEKQQAVFDKLSAKIMRDMDNRIALAKAEGATREELHTLELERLRKEENVRKTATALELGMLKEKQLLYKRYLKEGNEDRAKETSDEIKTIRAKYQTLKSLDGQYAVDKKVLQKTFDAETNREQEANAKEQASKAKEWADKRRSEDEAEAKLKLERERLYQDLMVQNIEDENLRKRTAMNIAHERERQDLIAKYGQDVELLKQLETQQASEIDAHNKELQAVRDADKEEIAQAEIERAKINAELKRTNEKAQLEGELIAMREDFDVTQALKAELALIEMETALEQENLTEGEKFKIKEEYNAKLLALKEESADRMKAIDKDAMDTSIAISEQGNNAIQQLSDLVFDLKGRNLEKGSAEELKAAKKQFKVNKALQLSMAIVDGFKSITTSLSQSPLAIGPIPNPAGIASLAFAAVTTGVNIAKIASSKFSGGGGGGGGASMPTVNAPSIPSQAEISGGTDNESTLTSGLQDNNAPSNKVVLVDSDIKAGLDNEAKVDVISTIG